MSHRRQPESARLRYGFGRSYQECNKESWRWHLPGAWAQPAICTGTQRENIFSRRS